MNEESGPPVQSKKNFTNVVVILACGAILSALFAVPVLTELVRTKEVLTAKPTVQLDFIPGLTVVRSSRDSAGDDAGVFASYHTRHPRGEVERLLGERLREAEGWKSVASHGSHEWTRSTNGRPTHRVRLLSTDKKGRTAITLKEWHPEWNE